MRTRKKIFLGDGGDPEMIAAIRAHGNLIELAPLMPAPASGCCTDRSATAPSPSWRIILLVARLLHAGGMLGFDPVWAARPEPSPRRWCWPIASIMLVLAGIRAL